MSMRYPGGLIATSPVNARYPSGVWTQAQAAPYQAQNVWTRDQFWPNTTLLLQGDGATNGAQNNTFLDSSSNNFTITRNGNTTQGAFTPYEQDGYWSNYFGGSGDFIYVADSSAFTLGSGDFTVEAWVWTGVTATQKVISGQIDGSGTTASLSYQLELSSSDFPRLIIASGGTLYIATSSVTLPKNQWVHLAGVRDGSTLRIYVNGVQYGTQSVTGVTVNDSSANVSVGRHGQYAGLDWNGYISNFRLVKGTCVYPNGTTFTPSTAPLTAITNTSLLTCQSNRFRDNSTNAFTVTVSGSPSVQAFQPFPGATTWSASVLGGSGYFDGSGDYLTFATNTAFSFGTGDFTISTWIYTGVDSLSPGGYSRSLFTIGNITGYLRIAAYHGGTTGAFRAYIGASTICDGSTVKLSDSAWHNITIVRESGNVRHWIDGVYVGTVAYSTSITNTITNGIGADMNGPDGNWNGYIAGTYVNKGTALFTGTSNITVPSTPPTTSSGNSLLVNYTNGGIYDNSMMNNLETVGNAQVSTSVVKYGTGSMAFDGTDDRLTAPASPNLAFNTGDFTVEGWIYTGSTGNLGVFQISGTAGGLQANQTNNTAVYCNNLVLGAYYGGTYKSGTTPIVANTWTHFALVRSSSVTRLYVNGVLDSGFGSNSDTQNYTGQNICVGGYFGTSNLFNGYIDDLRITKGAARYITNFTPPIARLPAQ